MDRRFGRPSVLARIEPTGRDPANDVGRSADAPAPGGAQFELADEKYEVLGEIGGVPRLVGHD